MSAPRIVLLPGDGIGPEIVAAARRVLDAVGELRVRASTSVGGASIDAHGTALTDEVLEACRAADAVLLGAVGGPKWDTTDPSAPRPEQGLLGLRKGLGLYANLRPVRPSAVAARRPARCARSGSAAPTCSSSASSPAASTSATRGRDGDRAHDTCDVLGRPRSSGSPASASTPPARAPRPRHLGRQGQRARDLAPVARDRGPRWRRATPEVELDHLLVDNAAMQLVSEPARFDVILTENLFGDILCDEAAMLTGSLGMLPSASLGDDGPGHVRARARLGARHRRQGHRQPARDAPLGGDDAAPRPRACRRGRGGRGGGRGGARARPAHPRPRPGSRPSCRRCRPAGARSRSAPRR